MPGYFPGRLRDAMVEVRLNSYLQLHSERAALLPWATREGDTLPLHPSSVFLRGFSFFGRGKTPHVLHNLSASDRAQK